MQPLHYLDSRFRKDSKECRNPRFRSDLKIQLKSWTLNGMGSCVFIVSKPGRVKKKISARLVMVLPAYLEEGQRAGREKAQLS